MEIILLLMVIAVLCLIMGIFYVIRKLKSHDFDDNVVLLEKVFLVTSILVGVAYAAITIITAISIAYSELFFVLFVKTLIYTILLIRIFKNGRQLIINLKLREIFVDKNVKFIETIGISFAYLALSEMISGLVIQFFYFISQISSNFTLMLNEELLIYLSIGILLIIVSKILHLAIEIHEENKLTI